MGTALFCFVGCAASSVDLKPNAVAPDEGAVLGRVRVLHEGKDITGDCYVDFVDAAGETKRLSLDETGGVSTSMKLGRTAFGPVDCVDAVSYVPKHLDFVVVGGGDVTYFGSVILRVEGSTPSPALLMLGAVGTAIALENSKPGSAPQPASSNEPER